MPLPRHVRRRGPAARTRSTRLPTRLVVRNLSWDTVRQPRLRAAHGLDGGRGRRQPRHLERAVGGDSCGGPAARVGHARVRRCAVARVGSGGVVRDPARGWPGSLLRLGPGDDRLATRRWRPTSPTARPEDWRVIRGAEPARASYLCSGGEPVASDVWLGGCRTRNPSGRMAPASALAARRGTSRAATPEWLATFSGVAARRPGDMEMFVALEPSTLAARTFPTLPSGCMSPAPGSGRRPTSVASERCDGSGPAPPCPRGDLLPRYVRRHGRSSPRRRARRSRSSLADPGCVARGASVVAPAPQPTPGSRRGGAATPVCGGATPPAPARPARRSSSASNGAGR